MQSCVLQAPNSGRKSSILSSSTSGTTSTPAVAPTFASDELAYWFTTTKITGTVTLNKTSQDIIYLRGKYIHEFLSAKDSSGNYNYKKQFCLVANFSNSGFKQTRMRALPLTITTSTTEIKAVANKASERILRIDYPSANDNYSACGNTTIDSFDPSISPSPVAYSFPQICTTNCSGMVTSSSLNLYELSLTQIKLTKVNVNSLDLTNNFMRIDLNSNSTSPISECTNASCSTKGFDCCISGQCVKDGSEKLNASSDPQYNQSKIDITVNPLSFINYPNIYYICSNISRTPTTTPTDNTNNLTDAQARINAYIKDYTCLNKVELDQSYTQCRSLDSSGNPTSTDQTENAYLAIKKKLAYVCGCAASESEMAAKCPDWGVVPVYKSGAAQTLSNIIDFTCYTPQPPNPIGPITNLNVTVPNKSAPLRFYGTDGKNYDDLNGMLAKSPSLTQEGDDFYYIDEFNKIGPVNNSYNINSVLGKITIDLSHAMPAKMINIEIGKNYILSATSGYFTPCTKCAKDSWFQSFSAFPNTQRGLGLQASGYTTSRDTYSGNTTFGNYEDTKFGRACYIPVTMIPFSHQKNLDIKAQRQNRLKTQAAFFINGYQRDWFGFNKGALIGSFDGVTWFAIGSGRRITATSTKLYLAINAAFLDLADRTDTIVNIIPDFYSNTAASVDYDPEIPINDPKQNTAASCQQYHQCNNDADCVTQLGWEYACADISQVKTTWPVYDSDAKETTNQEVQSTLTEILQNTISTTTSKRCVYRGMGAPCKRDYSTFTNNEYDKKLYTCAPNFYCASLTSNKFNDELSRSPNELGDNLFGMESNVLGRPLNYVNATKTLSTEIISNIKHGTRLKNTEVDDLGICRPGRSLNSNDLSSHMNGDLAKRADYISQIGSCDSSTFGSSRYITCPAFGDDLNYKNPTDVDIATIKRTQNICGAESKNATTNLSAFRVIEALFPASQQKITQPSLVQDACYRRAGSICNSDLDCAPNSMHEVTASTLDTKSFGDTEAEQNFWKESLICGQGTPVPNLGSATYFSYQLNQNRCCRATGKDFTMYTSPSGISGLIPDVGAKNISLNTDPISTGAGVPVTTTTTNRYSRYNISKNAILDSIIPKIDSSKEPVKSQWKTIAETGSLTCCGGGWVRKFSDGTHDWKVKNRLSFDTNNFSCLNYRSPLASPNYNKFSTDNINQNSYNKEYNLFCSYLDSDGCIQIPYQASNGWSILPPKSYEPALNYYWESMNDPVRLLTYARINTIPIDPTDTSKTLHYHNSADAPYPPEPFYYSYLNPDQTRIDVQFNQDGKQPQAYPFFSSKTLDFGVEIYLPAYVPWDGTTSNSTYMSTVKIKYAFYNDTTKSTTYRVDSLVLASAAECAQAIHFTQNLPTKAFPADYLSTDNSYCIYADASTNNRPVLVAKASKAASTAGFNNDWTWAGLLIDFKPVWENKLPTTPGNPLYYLSRLAKFELLGIPQITFDPLYCNDDSDKIVPGLFSASISTRADFLANGIAYSRYATDPALRYQDDPNENVQADTPQNWSNSGGGFTVKDTGNSDKRFVYQNKVDSTAHPAVFSSKDFTCCTPLGKTPSAPANCCSGYAVLSKDGKTSTCKLPSGTDLHVYFNKFVSGEGVGDSEPGGGLVYNSAVEDENDFNAYTGEPKMRQTTLDKITSLGKTYCEGANVIPGGGSGYFAPEPFTGNYQIADPANASNVEKLFPESIVDSAIDFQDPGKSPSKDKAGKFLFDSGYRWNHHYYCDK